MRLGCVVNTLLTFFELDELTVTIEGSTAETGHEIYNSPLRFYGNQVAGFGDIYAYGRTTPDEACESVNP